MAAMSSVVIGVDSMTNTCRQDPFFCAEMTPFIYEEFEDRYCGGMCTVDK